MGRLHFHYISKSHPLSAKLLQSRWNCKSSAHQAARAHLAGCHRREDNRVSALLLRCRLREGGRRLLCGAGELRHPAPRALAGERAMGSELGDGPRRCFIPCFCRRPRRNQPTALALLRALIRNLGAAAVLAVCAVRARSRAALRRSAGFSCWAAVRKEVLQVFCRKSQALGTFFIYSYAFVTWGPLKSRYIWNSFNSCAFTRSYFP